MLKEICHLDELMENQALSVGPDNFPELQLVLFTWYRDMSTMYYAEPPNITDLLDQEENNVFEGYYRMFIDVIAQDICDKEGWRIDVHVETAYEIIWHQYDWFANRLKHDMKLIMDSHQLFYAEDYKTVVQGDYIDFNHEVFYNSPLQEVW